MWVTAALLFNREDKSISYNWHALSPSTLAREEHRWSHRSCTLIILDRMIMGEDVVLKLQEEGGNIRCFKCGERGDHESRMWPCEKGRRAIIDPRKRLFKCPNTCDSTYIWPLTKWKDYPQAPTHTTLDNNKGTNLSNCGPLTSPKQVLQNHQPTHDMATSTTMITNPSATITTDSQWPTLSNDTKERDIA